MSPPDTKQRILDAAEGLFAREGFHSTSLRAITGEAQANLAAVNYHFGSKESLLQSVLERRLVPLNELRRKNLEEERQAARSEGRRPRAGEVLRAFIEPTIRVREEGRGADEFIRLVGHILAEPDDAVRMIFLNQMRPLFHLLFETLGEALPGLPKDVLFWRLQFSLGAMGHTLCLAGRFPFLPPGVTLPKDSATLTGLLLDFVSAGVEAPCD